jgi:hypothetical protein
MAGELSAKLTRSIQIGGITIGGLVETILSDGQVQNQKTVPASSTNAEFDVAVTIANVKAIALWADKDCTVKTNSTSVPDETLALKANSPMVWSSTDPVAGKFITHDITKLYVTTGAADTLLKFGAAVDSTPVLPG